MRRLSILKLTSSISPSNSRFSSSMSQSRTCSSSVGSPKQENHKTKVCTHWMLPLYWEFWIVEVGAISKEQAWLTPLLSLGQYLFRRLHSSCKISIIVIKIWSCTPYASCAACKAFRMKGCRQNWHAKKSAIKNGFFLVRSALEVTAAKLMSSSTIVSCTIYV